MKLAKLKERVFRNWQQVNVGESAIAAQDFKSEIRQNFGDLRRKSTWEKALARYYAHRLVVNCLDAVSLIAYSLNFAPNSEYFEYRYEIMDEFLAFPEGLELIKVGLDQLNYSNAKDREKAHGFFELVSGQPQQRYRSNSVIANWGKRYLLSQSTAS